MANLWRNSIYLWMEVNLLLFFIVLFYLHGQELPPILGLVVPTLLAIFFYSVIYLKIKIETHVLIVFLAPLLALVSYLFGYGYLLSFIIGAMISWRGFQLIVQEKSLAPKNLFLLSILWMMSFYIFIAVSNYKYTTYFLYLVGFQLVLYVIGQIGFSILKTWSNRDLSKKIIISTSSFIGMIIASLFILGTVGVFIIQLLLKAFGGIIGLLFGILAQPFFWLAQFLDFKLVFRDEDVVRLPDEGEPEFDSSVTETVEVAQIGDITPVIVTVIILALIIAYFFLRKVKVTRFTEEVAATYNGIIHQWNPSTQRVFWQKAPENEVRKLVFELEKLAYKKNRARKHNETLEEWLVRESVISEHFFKLYEKARYGEMELTENELTRCKQLATEIRGVIRKWKKN